ncbi:MAG: ABC transporter ATP-binding protein [Candidatus Woykebacteria bacterium RBG_13_40_7b]|uniref:ABC transporter ATP-binding protein n=1 Tax=Candidatus Woykebacteria bacterium RBG_13_40_7b TaxID=1802594 RepID=A0A1G1WC90_9BACT|nr:MAG: ABC transporter ATP-binding protein [Candidatus Woykebacteria bacterium RBG_13_40_7b]
MSLIEIKDLTKLYKSGRSTIHAVDGINLTVNKGDFLAIIGPSGSGKSTLLQLLGCLDKQTSGEFKIDDKEVGKLNDRKLADLRQKKIGFIFQNFNLIPTLTARQNVEAAIGKRSRDDKAKTLEALKRVGLEERANHLPTLLSGGEQQRVAIARALINGPEIILADEPTGNLDSQTGKMIFDLLHELSKSENTTVIVVTHDLSIAGQTDKTYHLKDGRIK